MSLVVVTWNAKRYAWECLTSLIRQHGHLSTEIIVVDNASSDGTADLVREEFPQVRLICNRSNLGFGTANNIGIREAIGKYICLINSDVTVPVGCLEGMFSYMEEELAIGILGPQMLGADGGVRRSTMRFPTFWNTFCRALALDTVLKGLKLGGGFLMTDFGHDETMEVDVLNGWFWMVRRSALDEVGPLDERFFIYGEDIDWCRRFHQAGWRVVFYPGVSAVHYGGASSANAPLRFFIEMQRANFQYWEKHCGRVERCGFLVSSWLHHVVRIVSYGAMYVFWRSGRPETAFKVKRSIASLLWLSGLKRPDSQRDENDGQL